MVGSGGVEPRAAGEAVRTLRLHPAPHVALPVRPRRGPVHEPAQEETRSSAQGNCSAKSLAGNVTDSSLSSLYSAKEGSGGKGVWGRGFGGRGVGEGEGGAQGGGGRGHFIHLAIYCTTTWCIALKGLRTIRGSERVLVKTEMKCCRAVSDARLVSQNSPA